MSLLRVGSCCNRALLRGARVTVVWRRTACASAALLRSPPIGEMVLIRGNICGGTGGIASLAAFLMGDAWTGRHCFARRRWVLLMRKRPHQRSFSCSFRSSRAERTAATTNAENVQSLPRITTSISSSISLGKRTDLLVVGGTLGILKVIVLTCNTIYMTSVLHNARNMCTINV